MEVDWAAGASGRAGKGAAYRTAIKLHDSYFAAASQRAALAAYVTDKPLFASSAAEIVTDVSNEQRASGRR